MYAHRLSHNRLDLFHTSGDDADWHSVMNRKAIKRQRRLEEPLARRAACELKTSSRLSCE
jgi:hypothetical protein